MIAESPIVIGASPYPSCSLDAINAAHSSGVRRSWIQNIDGPKSSSLYIYFSARNLTVPIIAHAAFDAFYFGGGVAFLLEFPWQSSA